MLYFWKAGDTRISEIKFAGTTGTTGTSGTRYIRYQRYLKSVACGFNYIFSLLTIGVIYFWKGGDTRMSEIKFAGTTGPTGTSGTRYIRYNYPKCMVLR